MLYTIKPPNFTLDFEVVGCYPEYNGKLLFLLRHPKKIQGNTWCIPGGKVDKGETLEQAALRELYEESGIVAQPSDIQYHASIYKTDQIGNFSFHMFTLKLTELPAVKVNRSEHTEYIWVTPEEALEMKLIADEDTCIKMIYNL